MTKFGWVVQDDGTTNLRLTFFLKTFSASGMVKVAEKFRDNSDMSLKEYT